jgi:hypothetical protein
LAQGLRPNSFEQRAPPPHNVCPSTHDPQEDAMPTELGDEALDHLLTHAGLSLTPAQKAELKPVYAAVAAMAERVRRPRGPMAELGHTYGFNDEDL